MMEKFIKKRLVDKQMSVAELARRMGTSRSAVVKNLASDMRVSTLFRMADAMGYDVLFMDKISKEKVRVQ